MCPGPDGNHPKLINTIFVYSETIKTDLQFITKHWNCTVQPAYKVVQIQGMSAYSVRSQGPDSCECKGIGMGESRLFGFSGYRGGPEPFHIGGLHCTTSLEK